MRILLYCIFTNEYVKLIKPWLETTAKNFYPHCSDVLILTDNPDIIEDRRGLIVEKIESLPFRNQELWMKNKRHMERWPQTPRGFRTLEVCTRKTKES